MEKVPATSQYYEALMYRLIKSEKFTHNHEVSGSMLSYRQIQLNQFRQFSAAFTTCEVANVKVGSCHCVLNESGEEFYIGIAMSKSRQSNKEAKMEAAMTPQEKRAAKKESPTFFGNALVAIKLRGTSKQASVCS
jgi:hypothetical protein